MSYYPNRVPPLRRRGCFPLAVLGLIALVVLVGIIVVIAWSHQRQEAGSSGGAPLTLVRPTTARLAATVTPLVGLPPQTLATPRAEAPANPIATATPAFAGPDWAALQRVMLEAINEDRAAAGLPPVVWDQLAADVGAAHAQEMVTHGYFSHWDLAGQGPDLRYALAGGVETVNENLHLYWLRYDDGRGAPIEEWDAVVLAGQKGLMDSPGHRANILDPAHTHVGIGMAYDVATGTLAIAQEFFNRYVALDAPPQRATRGERYLLKGDAIGGVSNLVVNIRYLPHPDPLTVAQLEQKPSTYQSESTFFDYGEAHLNGGIEVAFELPDDAPPGIYLVCVWGEVARLPGEETQVLTLALPLHD